MKDAKHAYDWKKKIFIRNDTLRRISVTTDTATISLFWKIC